MHDRAIAGQRQLVARLPVEDALVATKSASHARHPPIVAIDAGHGGKGPGAISTRNHCEKCVALAVAIKRHRLLAGNAWFQPIMIRDDDRFISLQERAPIVHRRKADPLVSIHADAAPVLKAQGASGCVREAACGSTLTRAPLRQNSQAACVVGPCTLRAMPGIASA